MITPGLPQITRRIDAKTVLTVTVELGNLDFIQALDGGAGDQGGQFFWMGVQIGVIFIREEQPRRFVAAFDGALPIVLIEENPTRQRGEVLRDHTLEFFHLGCGRLLASGSFHQRYQACAVVQGERGDHAVWARHRRQPPFFPCTHFGEIHGWLYWCRHVGHPLHEGVESLRQQHGATSEIPRPFGHGNDIIYQKSNFDRAEARIAVALYDGNPIEYPTKATQGKHQRGASRKDPRGANGYECGTSRKST